MTARTEIITAGQKAAQKIREALAEFGAETGMPADVEAEWIAHGLIDQRAPNFTIGRVTLKVGGTEVDA